MYIVVDNDTEVISVIETSELYTLDQTARTLSVLGSVTNYPTVGVLNFHETADLNALKATLEGTGIIVTKINNYLSEFDEWKFTDMQYRATVWLAQFAINHPDKLAQMINDHPAKYEVLNFSRQGRVYFDQILPEDASLVGLSYCKFEQYNSETQEITVL